MKRILKFVLPEAGPATVQPKGTITRWLHVDFQLDRDGDPHLMAWAEVDDALPPGPDPVRLFVALTGDGVPSAMLADHIGSTMLQSAGARPYVVHVYAERRRPVLS